jgi:hypothetical protein
MTKRGIVVGAVALAIALSGAAHANTVVLNETVDETSPTFLIPAVSPFLGIEGWGSFADVGGAFSPDYGSFDLAVGDTLDFTARFLPGQSLRLHGPAYLEAYVISQDGQSINVSETGALTLLKPDGTPLLTSNSRTDNACCGVFIQIFQAADFASLPNWIKIGGVRYVGTVGGYDSVTTRTYTLPELIFEFHGTVPEPAAWTVMLLGLGAVGHRLRRRRRSAAPA